MLSYKDKTSTLGKVGILKPVPLKFLDHSHTHIWASLVAQMIKNLPAMRETSVRSLGWEYPLE